MVDQEVIPTSLTPAEQVIVERLLAEAEGDIAAALALAATTIIGLSSAASFGIMRAVPYATLMPPKPKPPVIDGGE